MIKSKTVGKLLLAATALTAVFTATSQAQVINPYEAIKGEWITLPDGREWGATSTVYYAGEGNIWVAERCGGNTN